MKRKLLGIAFALLLTLIIFIPYSVRATQKTKVTGKIIGYSMFSLFDISRIGRTKPFPHQVLLVQVIKDAYELRKGQFVKVRFSNTEDNRGDLPEEMLEKSGRWEMSLTRDVSCDEPIESLIYLGISDKKEATDKRFLNLQRVSGAEKIKLPQGVGLPCYVFYPGDYRKIN